VPVLGELPLARCEYSEYLFVLGNIRAVKEPHRIAGAAWRDNMLQVTKCVALTLWNNPDVAKKVRYMSISKSDPGKLSFPGDFSASVALVSIPLLLDHYAVLSSCIDFFLG
jgi:hypothetical protein